jgi:hypothetical protein
LGVHFKELVTHPGERALVFNMHDNLVDVNAHRFENHIVNHRGDDVNSRLFNLDVKHGDEQPDQCLDMCVLLREQ